MSCRVLGGPDFGSSLKGMGLLYRNLWGSGLSRKKVPFFGIGSKVPKTKPQSFLAPLSLRPMSNTSTLCFRHAWRAVAPQST